jgi:hypothetical protein
MSEARITARQMKRLQTLWGMVCKQVGAGAPPFPAASAREARLAWVGGKIGREIGSFKDLTLEEAKRAIQEMQKLLPPSALRASARRPGRRTARAYGTAGRKGFESSELRLVDARTWALIDRLLGELGWTRERLDAFIRSAKSPTRGRLVKTLDDANRVIWTLKGMLRRAETATAGAHGRAADHTPQPATTEAG